MLTLFCLENILCLLNKSFNVFIIATKKCVQGLVESKNQRTWFTKMIACLSFWIITYTSWDGGFYFALWFWFTSVQGASGAVCCSMLLWCYWSSALSSLKACGFTEQRVESQRWGSKVPPNRQRLRARSELREEWIH